MLWPGVRTGAALLCLVAVFSLVPCPAAIKINASFGSRAYGTKVLSNGNIVFVGMINSDTTNNIGAGQTQHFDPFVVMVDSSETVLWRAQISNVNAVATGVCIDGSDNVYVVGYIDPVGATYNQLTGQTALGLQDGFLWKLNSAGVVQYSLQQGTTGNDKYEGCAVDSSNSNIYISGTTDGTLAGQTHYGNVDSTIVKVTASAGALVWHRQYGATDLETPGEIAVDTSDNTYVVGRRRGANDLNTCPGCGTGIGDLGFVISADSTGAHRWTYVSGSNSRYFGVGVHSNEIYVTGHKYFLVSGAQIDMMNLLKFDNNGNLLYEVSITSTSNARGLDVAFYGSSVFVAGYAGSVMPLTNNPTISRQNPAVFEFSKADGTLLATDQFSISDTLNCQIMGISMGSDGSRYLAVDGYNDGSLSKRENPSNCAAGNFLDVTSNFAWDMCKQCPPQTYSTAAGQYSCLPCSSGQISSADFQSCVDCPANTYATNVTCLACPTGSFSDVASIVCTPCSQGYYASPNATSCQACPKGQYSDGEGMTECKVCPGQSSTQDVATMTIAQCICLKSEYGDVEANPIRNCTACPDEGTSNVYCDGGLWPKAEKNYYNSRDYRGGEFALACVPPSACPGGDIESCATGYKGFSCNECDSGYFRKQGLCVICPGQSILSLVVYALLVILVGVGLVIATVLFLASPWIRKLRKYYRIAMGARAAVQRLISLQIAFLQMAGTILTLGLSFSFPAMDIFMNTMDFASVDISQFTETSCATNAHTPYYAKFYMKMILPIILILLILVVKFGVFFGSLLANLRRKKADGEDDVPVCGQAYVVFLESVGMFALLMNVFYFVLHKTVTEPFQCTMIGDGSSFQWVLSAEPGLDCYNMAETDWFAAVPGAAVCFVFYSVGIPATFGMVLLCVRNRRRRQDSVALNIMFGFLWENFDADVYFWEAVIVLKKFAMGVGLILGFKGPYDQAVVLYLIGFVSFVAHTFYKPFTSPFEDALETTALLMTILLLTLSLIGTPSESGVSSLTGLSLEIVATVALFFQVACTAVLLVLVIRAAFKNRHALEEKAERKKAMKRNLAKGKKSIVGETNDGDAKSEVVSSAKAMQLDESDGDDDVYNSKRPIPRPEMFCEQNLNAKPPKKHRAAIEALTRLKLQEEQEVLCTAKMEKELEALWVSVMNHARPAILKAPR